MVVPFCWYFIAVFLFILFMDCVDLFRERSEMVYAAVSDYMANRGKFNEKKVLTLSTAWDGRTASPSACILHWSRDKEGILMVGIDNSAWWRWKQRFTNCFSLYKRISLKSICVHIRLWHQLLKKNSNNKTKIKTSCGIWVIMERIYFLWLKMYIWEGPYFTRNL